MKYSIETTRQFDKWLSGRKNRPDRIRIAARLTRIEDDGSFGDHKKIGKALYEMRFFAGSGFRIYYTIRSGAVVLLLVGGDKSSQPTDVRQAAELLKTMEKRG